MYSPLLSLFDDPRNTGWVKPSGTMTQSDGSGNGFGWGQLSHLLGWVLYVGDLEVEVHIMSCCVNMPIHFLSVHSTNVQH